LAQAISARAPWLQGAFFRAMATDVQRRGDLDPLLADSLQVYMVEALLQGTRVGGVPAEEATAVLFRPPCGVLSDMFYHFLFDGALMFYLWRAAYWGLCRPMKVLLPHDAPFAAHFAGLFGDDFVVVEQRDRRELFATKPQADLAKGGVHAPQRAVKGCGKGARAPPAQIELPPGTIEVYFPKVGASWGPHPKHFSAACLSFRTHILARCGPGHAAAGPSLVCIFRRRWGPAGPAGNRRTIENEDAVREVAQRVASAQALRYEEPMLETLGIWDQIHIFTEAKVVIAQHGSALANVLWMPPGAAVVEVGLPGPCSSYQALCQACRVRWSACQSPGPSDGVLTVSVLELEEALQLCCSDDNLSLEPELKQC